MEQPLGTGFESYGCNLVIPKPVLGCSIINMCIRIFSLIREENQKII